MTLPRLLALAALLLCGAVGAGTDDPDAARRAPEFTSSDPDDWLNSPPLRLAQYEGKVVLVEFWTTDCGNCQRSVPWLQSLLRRQSPRGLRVIGVHTPEFEREKSRQRVERYTRGAAISWPILLDDDARYWHAIGNRFWPTFWLVDKRGVIRGALAGETLDGDFNATQLERVIEELLAEPG